MGHIHIQHRSTLLSLLVGLSTCLICPSTRHLSANTTINQTCPFGYRAGKTNGTCGPCEQFGGNRVFCNAPPSPGSIVPVRVSPKYYTTGAGNSLMPWATRTSQEICPAGSWCYDGEWVRVVGRPLVLVPSYVDFLVAVSFLHSQVQGMSVQVGHMGAKRGL